MKIVFDENVPWPLRNLLPGHEVTSVQREGFGGKGNGELLGLLDGKYDVLVLCDKNLRYQQKPIPHLSDFFLRALCIGVRKSMIPLHVRTTFKNIDDEAFSGEH